ncbi:MAG: glutaredoxin [Myxococcales bacterium]|nr:glutaredoxin [Myxococcales bacterium]
MESERALLDPTHVHPAIREKVATHQRAIVQEVKDAAAKHDVLVVGMSQNPHPRRAKRLLAEKNVPFHYLEYGSYLSDWRRRTALKMWSGWPTFPMIFVKGTLIGGADDLARLIESGELSKLLA